MLDALLSARDPLRTAIESSVPGITPKLYVGSRPDTVAMPHAWVRAGGETVARETMEEFTELVYLDIYARSTGEAQTMENAVAFLDDYRPPSFGNALAPHYMIQNKSRLPEAQGVEHVTCLYTVRYVDKRKTIPGR